MIKHIEFAGKTRPVKYGMNAMSLFGDITKTRIEDIDLIMTNMKFSEMRSLVYSGLIDGARSQKTDIDFTIDDVGDWLDEEFDKFNEFFQFFTERMVKIVGAVRGVKEEVQDSV